MTNVVPMPSYSRCDFAFAISSSLVVLSAASIAEIGVLSLLSRIKDTKRSTENREAKSPALCPPIPSATMYRFGSMPTGSSELK